MFDIEKITRTFEWPVVVEVPTKNGGFERFKFTCKYHQVDIDELKSCDGTDKEVANKVLAGWGHDLKRGDEPLEYNDESRAEVLAYIPATAAIAKGFYEAMNGDKARLKN